MTTSELPDAISHSVDPTTVDWAAWDTSRPTLPKLAVRRLAKRWGSLEPIATSSIASARVPASRLDEAALQGLHRALGADAVAIDDDTRARHAGGQSLIDLLRRRAGDAVAAPDAVVIAADTAAVVSLLRTAAVHDLAVVPWGGGTSVVGGLENLAGHHRAVIALDLGRLDKLLSVDRTSLLATFEPGIATPAAEIALAAHGLRLAHLPQSYARASIGGYVVTRSAGQSSSGTGRIDDLVVGLKMQTPSGELVVPPLPASAAGPDLRRIVLGSEGTLGVLTEVTLRVRPLAKLSHYEAWMAPNWEAGTEALRRLAQGGTLPDVLRLSDPHETDLSLALSSTPAWQQRALRAWLKTRKIRRGCMIIAGFEGDKDDIAYRRRIARKTLRQHGAVPIGTRAGSSWHKHRFGGPATRDSLLDAGIIVETLETAALWTDLQAVFDATRASLLSTLPDAEVGCHVSHLYPTGASLYFTVLYPARGNTSTMIKQWEQAKSATTDALVAAGGTVTHHHAVGAFHRDHASRDLGGDIGVRMIRALQTEVDPAHLLNPDKLLPPVD